jgi:hypothetical protein
MTAEDVNDMSDALIAIHQKFKSLNCDITLLCLGTAEDCGAIPEVAAATWRVSRPGR